MFQSLIGQDYAVAALKEAVRQGRLPGTYLFAGPEHVGKSRSARELAKAVNCLAPVSPGECCDTCRSCRAIDAGSHPDVRSVAPTGPSRTLRIGQFWPREGIKDHPPDRALLRDLQYAPVSAKKRVFIVEDAEAMGEDTANSLLKVLEEPPAYALFVLTAPTAGAVLPTIASRSLTLRFRLAPAPLIEEALVSIAHVPKETAHFLAAFSQGRVGTAISLAHDSSLLSSREALLDLAEEVSARPPQIAAFRLTEGLRKLAGKLGSGAKDDAVEEKGQRTGLAQALDMLALWFGDLLTMNVLGGEAALVNADRAPAVRTAASRFEQNELESILRLLVDTRRYVERNANAQIALEALLMRLLASSR